MKLKSIRNIRLTTSANKDVLRDYDHRLTLDAVSLHHRDSRSCYSKIMVGYAYKQEK